MAAPLPLEGDGLVENLFHYLWTTDDLGGGPSVSIPSTVIYHGSQPVAWYFTSRKSGRIKRKHRANLTAAHIELAFTKRKAAADIVAYYLYLPNQGSANPAIEYYDAEGLREFLFKRPEIPRSSSPGAIPAAGILQQFTLPKGARNSTLRAVWSPKLCLLERRVNVHTVHDARFSVYERGITFEEGGGAEALSQAEPVRGSILPGMVQQLCERVVDHVTRVSYHKFRIVRMVLRLQVDAEDRLWLLWSSSLRLQPPLTPAITSIGSDVAANEVAIRPLDIVNDAKVPNFAFAQGAGSGPTALSFDTIGELEDEPRAGQARCASCARVVSNRALLPTTYKAVLAHFQHVLRFLRENLNEENQVAIEWPPDDRVVKQAGGVGFGILKHLTATNLNSDDGGTMKSVSASGIRTWQGRDLLVPPVIQYLHPTLRAEDFARHRQDPIFLHKTVGVCERCCLVYADYATASLEANGLGIRTSASAPALLRPTREQSKLAGRLDSDPSLLLITPNFNSPLANGTATKTKPPASAWQPVPSDERQRRKVGKYKLGPRSTLDSLPIAPLLPPRIETFDPDDNNALRIPGGIHQDGSPEHQQQEREEAFFRELYQQKDKRGGHALRHIVEAADRLSQAKPQHRLAALGGSAHIGHSQSTGALADAIADLRLSRKPGKSPYCVVQRLHGEKVGRRSPIKNKEIGSHSPNKQASQETKQQVGKKKRRKRDNAAVKPRFVSSRENRAAAAHRDFLIASLADAQVQLEHIESLATLVSFGQDVTDDEGENATKNDQQLLEKVVDSKSRPSSPQVEEPMATERLQQRIQDEDQGDLEDDQEHDNPVGDQDVRNQLEEVEKESREHVGNTPQTIQLDVQEDESVGFLKCEELAKSVAKDQKEDLDNAIIDNPELLNEYNDDEEEEDGQEQQLKPILDQEQDQVLQHLNQMPDESQEHVPNQYDDQDQYQDQDQDQNQDQDNDLGIEHALDQMINQVEENNRCQDFYPEQGKDNDQHLERSDADEDGNGEKELQEFEEEQDPNYQGLEADGDKYDGPDENLKHANDEVAPIATVNHFPEDARPMQDLLAQAHDLLANPLSSDSVDVDDSSDPQRATQGHNISNDPGDSSDQPLIDILAPLLPELDGDSDDGATTEVDTAIAASIPQSPSAKSATQDS